MSSCDLTQSQSRAEVVAVTTRAQAQASDVDRTVEDSVCDGLGGSLDDNIFVAGKQRRRLTRSQKRIDRRRHAMELKDSIEATRNKWATLDMMPEELAGAQRDDLVLEKPRIIAGGAHGVLGGSGFYYHDNGLLYRHWVPKRGAGTIEQLVLQTKCIDTALAITHEIPMGGHLGKTKRAQHRLQRFYWPTLHCDVAKYCRECRACQLDCSRRVQKAPLIPLPIIGEPFRRIAMDIVGPLPKTQSEDSEQEEIHFRGLQLCHEISRSRRLAIGRGPAYCGGIG